MSVELLRLGRKTRANPDKRYAVIEDDKGNRRFVTVPESVFEGFSGDVKRDRTVALSRLDADEYERVTDSFTEVDPLTIAERIEEDTLLSEQQSQVYVLKHCFAMERRNVADELGIKPSLVDQARELTNEKLDIAEETAELSRI